MLLSLIERLGNVRAEGPSRAGAVPVVLLSLLCLTTAASPSWAVDGVIEINHAKALAGGVTPGDGPGYPVRINEPGSYVLTGDLSLPDANTVGLRIDAEPVTIDLNGFTIFGTTVCTGAGASLDCAPTGFGNGVISLQRNLTIRNGSIRGVGQVGIVMRGDGNLVENIRAIGNGLVGIEGSLPGDSADIRNCVANGNNHAGILVHRGGVIEGNVVRDNLFNGMQFSEAGVVRGNVATGNGTSGIRVSSGVGNVIGNTSSANTGIGFSLNANVGYQQNVIEGNAGGTVSSGVETGTNLCDGSTTCP